MFARSNYCFFTPIGYSYFGNDATCDPNVELPSTVTGQDNAKIFGRMEARKGCPIPMDSCKKLGKVAASRLDLKRSTLKEEQ